MSDFYIRIEAKGSSDDHPYWVAHNGIERCGMSSEEVIVFVVEKLGFGDSAIGQAVHKEIVQNQYLEAQHRAASATAEATRLRMHLEGLDG